MPHSKKHRITLYTFVVVLLIMQGVFFTVLSIKVSNLNVKIDSGIAQVAEDSESFTTNLVETYDSLYQENFIEISSLLTEQQQDFEQQISLLQSSQEDFSGIVETAVLSVVTITAGNSVGSGFIIHSSGYLVTNYHVISGQEDNVFARTYDRNVFAATFVGKDELRDLALLKLEGEYLALALANSEELQAGKKVIAIGNPLGLAFTVTEGIVSATNRVGPNGLFEYVQTDVSLNPGNSGGPLIDTQGEVVGINNFKIGGAEALGFALERNKIPLGPVVLGIILGGQVEHSFIQCLTKSTDIGTFFNSPISIGLCLASLVFWLGPTVVSLGWRSKEKEPSS